MIDSGLPDANTADEEGVVAVGGPFTAQRVLEGYRKGIFPWTGDPVRWYSPEPRAIFWEVRLPSRLGKVIRRHRLRMTCDQAFEDVINACAASHHRQGDWITPEFMHAYCELHRMGYAHSVEIWQESDLVGGLYGVQVNGLFAGESMFHKIPNTSKVAFAALCYQLDAIGVILFDCQVINLHTYQLGAVQVYRRDYLRMLELALAVSAEGSGAPWPENGFADLTGTTIADLDRPDPTAASCGFAFPPHKAAKQSRRFWVFNP